MQGSLAKWREHTASLSLGEKKRVALAGVLVLEPEVLLLDEPAAGLDYAGITSMLRLLGQLHQAGTTIVISTHDTDLAYEWAEEAWVLMDGRIAAQGPIEEVMQKREVLWAAHLRVPWLVEMGLAVQEAFPESWCGRLPRTRDQMMAQVRSSGTASAVEKLVGALESTWLSPAARTHPGSPP